VTMDLQLITLRIKNAGAGVGGTGSRALLRYDVAVKGNVLVDTLSGLNTWDEIQSPTSVFKEAYLASYSVTESSSARRWFSRVRPRGGGITLFRIRCRTCSTIPRYHFVLPLRRSPVK